MRSRADTSFSSSLPEEVQHKALKLVPGFENCKMFRPGYAIEYDYFPPTQLKASLETKKIDNLFFAGQMIGVEGYIESAATGLLAGMNAARLLSGQPLRVPPDTTAVGALLRYITDSQRKKFQPMNVNFGLLPPLSGDLRGKAKKEALSQRALADMAAWAEEVDGNGTAILNSSAALDAAAQ